MKTNFSKLINKLDKIRNFANDTKSFKTIFGERLVNGINPNVLYFEYFNDMITVGFIKKGPNIKYDSETLSKFAKKNNFKQLRDDVYYLDLPNGGQISLTLKHLDDKVKPKEGVVYFAINKSELEDLIES